MKIKKFRAPDSQQAMRMIRAELGPDAGILACNRVEDGVEFVVTIESDETPHASADATANGIAASGASRPEAAYSRARESAAEAPQPARHFSDDSPKVVWSQDAELLSLKRELGSMRSLLEQHLKGNTWEMMSAANPGCRSALDLLAELDIDPAVGERLAAHVPAEESPEIQRELIRSLLMKVLPVSAPSTSGVVALVGPPGSGKTTTIAKIAARHVMQGSRDDIALLTTDTARIGAQEQLRVFGRILQIPVHVAIDAEEAIRTFRMLQKKKLVLIDTAGMSFRDQQGIEQLQQLLTGLPSAEVLLTLPADMQTHALAETVETYSRLPLAGAILTRLDEAVRLGGLLSLLIERRLPVQWCTNGPRVPRNLFAADAGKIVALAMRLLKEFDSYTHEANREVRAGGMVNAVS